MSQINEVWLKQLSGCLSCNLLKNADDWLSVDLAL